VLEGFTTRTRRPEREHRDRSRHPHGGLRLAVVNDYEVIVAGVRAMLVPYSDRVEIVEFDIGQDPEQSVDVALFDAYGQPGLGLGRVRALAHNERVGAVAVYTWSLTKASRMAAYQAGARALIAKSLPAEALVESLQEVARGQIVETGGFRGAIEGPWPGSQWGLTARESETLALLATGMTNRAIAEALFVSENTVRTHLKAIFRKLPVTNRSQAVAQALSDPGFANRSAHVHVSDRDQEA
jgi:two-component system, NarL family, response regulator LiaR